jgi:gliding motility-associated-like protein
MRLTLLRFSAIVATFFSFLLSAKAQNCIPTNINGAVFNMPCGVTCQNINFQIPHIKSTSDYSVNTIPYNAYPYNNASGTEVTSIYVDDKYSPLQSLAFPFCFYGSVYNNFVVGSNGIVTFEQICANASNAYTLTVGGAAQPIPYDGPAAPSGIATTYYPRTAIMGAYHDIDPSASPLPTRRIEYNIVGTAPCRKLVVSFFDIRMFSCTSLICSEQIVLHESTGIIEVFLLNKPLCTTWPGGAGGGLAILGIQDETRTKAVAAPGKNCTQWSESNTGYRFTPSAGPSRFVSSQMFTMGGTLVASADTITTTAGLLDISFPNICPPVSGTQYRIVTTFSACDNPANFLTSEDTITVNTSTLTATETHTTATCGPPNGSITVTVPTGVGTAPYTYVLDGSVTQTGGSPVTFNNVAAGPHTVEVTDVTGCVSTLTLTVQQVSNLTANISPTPSACTGVNNGIVTVTPTIGAAPYTFTLNPGNIIQTGATASFGGLTPGAYSVTFTDANGCTSVTGLNATVTTGTGVTATSIATQATCADVNNGTITVTPTAGATPFQYSIDGGATYQASNVFTGLAPATYTIRVRDNVGCIRDITRTVTAGTSLNTNFTIAATTCSGANNGSVTITPVNGTAPYTFVLNGTTTQTGATTVFNNLPAGVHNITVTDANGCVRNPALSVTVLAGPALLTSATHTDALCNGSATGTITVAQPTAGTAPYEYSLDGTNWQTANTFNGLVAGIYTVYYREANGCQGQLSQTVTEPTALAATTATSSAICNGQSNGRIIVSSSGGVGPYEYSIDNGATWQTSNSFNMPAGNYTVIIRDANQCTTTQSVTITEPATLAATITTTNATCNGGNNGTIVISATGGNTSYEYSIDGGSSFLTTNSFNVAPGTYTINVRDNLGCNTTVPNIVVGLTNDLTFAPPANPTICEGTSTQLSITSNALQYAWSPATALSSTSVFNPTANPTTTTSYTVTLTYGRCTADVPVIVNVNAAPIPDAGADGFICYGQTYTLQGSGGIQYDWVPSTYLGTGLNTSNPVSAPDKTITYVLSVVDANGCRSLTTDSMVLDVTPPIYVNTFPFDTIVYNTDQFPILATSGATDYLWTPTVGLSDPTIANPTVTAGDIGDVIVYKVTASTQAGCKGEGYVRVQVYKGPDLYVPTGFTPNNDGKNDTFFPFPVGVKEIKYFRVFNRWGQLVFSTTKLNDGWDGTLSGKEQPSGVYVWMVEGVTKDNRPITKKGTIMLIR